MRQQLTDMCRWLVPLFVFATLFAQLSTGQYDEKDFIRYSVNDGLSDNYINCLQQDEWGYLWAGTENGLNRFDGFSFKKFYQGTEKFSLLSSQIYKLRLFSPQELGIISRGGFQLLNTRSLVSKNYIITDTTAFSRYLNSPWDVERMKSGQFAVSSNSGFYVFDASGELSFRHDAYRLKDIGQEIIRYGYDIFVVSETDYLINTEARGLAHFDAEKRVYREITSQEKEWSPFYTVSPGAKAGFIIRSQINHDEFIFINYSDNRLLHYKRSTDRKVESRLSLPKHEFNWDSRITFLNDTTFAVNAANFGFYLFTLNRLSGKITFAPRKYFSNYKVVCLYPDKDRRLWIGTSKGLFRQVQTVPFIKSFYFPHSPDDSLTGGFNCAYRHKDKLYLGRFSSNNGLVIMNETTGKLETQIQLYGGNNGWNQIRYIQLYHPDTLWLGTNAGLLWFDTGTYQYGKVFNENKYGHDPPILSRLSSTTSDGYTWMCSFMEGIIARYHIESRSFTFFTSETTPPLPFAKIKTIAYDAHGDVWAGGHSLARWNNRMHKFDTVISIYGGINKYEDDILFLTADHSGSLWFTTPYNGLQEYRINEKKFLNYTTKDGLPSDLLYGISPVINNRIWLNSNNALIHFDLSTKKFTVYDQKDGLPDDIPSSRYMYYDEEKGILYLFYQHTIATISIPEPFNADQSSDFIFEELEVNNNESFFYPTTHLNLRPDENDLALHFTLIDFESGPYYQFAYRLSESHHWTSLGEQRSLRLTGLSPGQYDVEVKATGKSGKQKSAILNFSIAPPFWKTAWFVVGCCLVIALALYYVYRRRIKIVQNRANLDKLLSQTEMKALHAQMNPHFIFNSLNSIGEMILNNENDEATHFLGKFANLIRLTLDQSGQSFISLRNTIDYLTSYIEMEQIRNDHFTYRITADEELDPDETVLPPMLIQPLIENAIWHGTTAHRKDININIDFKRSNGQLICVIDDNGRGIEQSLKNKNGHASLHIPVGITNIKNRIRLLNEKYGLKSSITIEDKSNLNGGSETGTLVILRLPIDIADNE